MTELGRAYGSALYALAEDEKQEDAFLSQLGEVCKLLADNPDYVRLIKDKAIAKTERLALLDGDRLVYPGHGGRTTLSQERRINPWMASAVRDGGAS